MSFLSKLFNREIDVNVNTDVISETPVEQTSVSSSSVAVSTVSEGTGSSFSVEDVFTIFGRGTVVTGKVISGSFQVGDVVSINGNTYEIAGIDKLQMTVNIAETGDSVGMLFADLKRNVVKTGDIINK